MLFTFSCPPRIAIDSPRPIAEFLTHSFTVEEVCPPDRNRGGFFDCDKHPANPAKRAARSEVGTSTARGLVEPCYFLFFAGLNQGASGLCMKLTRE